MGITDLFASPENKGKKFLNENDERIKTHIEEYHQSKDFDKGKPYDANDILPYVKGGLFKDYLGLVDSKDSDAKLFFEEPFFKKHVFDSTKAVYDFFEKIDIGNRAAMKSPNENLRSSSQKYQISQGIAAQESVNKLVEYSERLSDQSQRSKKKKS